jgi:hypothetical protein
MRSPRPEYPALQAGLASLAVPQRSPAVQAEMAQSEPPPLRVSAQPGNAVLQNSEIGLQP